MDGVFLDETITSVDNHDAKHGSIICGVVIDLVDTLES